MSTREKSLPGAGVAATLSVLAALTAFHPNWIELVFGIDLDAGSGWLEWTLIVVLALIALASATVAWRKWNDARA